MLMEVAAKTGSEPSGPEGLLGRMRVRSRYMEREQNPEPSE